MEPKENRVKALITTVKSKFSFEKALNIAITTSSWAKNIARVLDEMIIPELEKHVNTTETY